MLLFFCVGPPRCVCVFCVGASLHLCVFSEMVFLPGGGCIVEGAQFDCTDPSLE